MCKASLKRESPISERRSSHHGFREFAERSFPHAKLAAATDLSVKSNYEAKILRCPRLHSSM